MPRGKRKQTTRPFHRVNVQEIIDFTSALQLDIKIVGIALWTQTALSDIVDMQKNDSVLFNKLVSFHQPFIPKTMPKFPPPAEGWFDIFLKEHNFEKLGLPILPQTSVTLEQLAQKKAFYSEPRWVPFSFFFFCERDVVKDCNFERAEGVNHLH